MLSLYEVQVASVFQQGNMAAVYDDVRKHLDHLLSLQDKVLTCIQDTYNNTRTPTPRATTPSDSRTISRLSREVFAKLKAGQKLPPDSDVVQNNWQVLCEQHADGMTPDDLGNAIRDITCIADSIQRRLKGMWR